MSNTCYKFALLFLLTWFSQVATNFLFTSKISVTLLILKCLPWNTTKEWFAKIEEHEHEGNFSVGIRRDVQLGQFFLLSVRISQQLPRLTSLYWDSFLKWPLKLEWTFRWQQSGAFEPRTSPENWNLFFCKEQVIKNFSNNFHPNYLPINLCRFYWVFWFS